MKFDYKYIKAIDLCYDGTINQQEINQSAGLKAIKKHRELTQTDFTSNYIQQALSSATNFFGLNQLIENIPNIKKLLQYIFVHEQEIIETVEQELSLLFSETMISNIIIAPVIGYDYGIGINGIVAINLNNPILFSDTRELISLIIHEATHVIYEKVQGPLTKETFWTLNSTDDIKKSLNYFLQYEGIGLFASNRYRTVQDLGIKGTPMKEDYDYNRHCTLFAEYHRLIKGIINKSININHAFEIINKYRLPHRLGYVIIKNAANQNGIEGVKKIISMSNDKFVNRYLKLK